MRVRIYKVGNKYRAKIKTWYWPFWIWQREPQHFIPGGPSSVQPIMNFSSLKEARDHFKKQDEYTELIEEFYV